MEEKLDKAVGIGRCVQRLGEKFVSIRTSFAIAFALRHRFELEPNADCLELLLEELVDLVHRRDLRGVLNEEAARPILKRALELGINCMDTCGYYWTGRGEDWAAPAVICQA